MCLQPNIILNPNYSQHRHEFREIHLQNTVINQNPLGDSYYYPVNLPPFSSLWLDNSTISDFYAVDDDGTCVPIFMAVPCGKCLECIESKRSAIRVRMYLEQMSHEVPPIFVTLTYNNEHLPSDGVSKTDVKRFLNRLHLYLGRAGRSTYFRHVFFSEYGHKNGRAHYHGVLFGLDLKDTYDDRMEFFNVLEKAWGKGFVRYDIIHSRAFQYVSKYVGKDAFSDIDLLPCDPGFDEFIKKPKKNPNFWTASRRDGGLGSKILESDRFLELCHTPHFPTITIPVDDRTYTVTLPAYVRDKILPPLRKYISREIREAYIQSRKDLCLLDCLRDNKCIFSGLISRITDSANEFLLSNSSSRFDILPELFKNSDYVISDCLKIVSPFDQLLGFYYGSDEYWKKQFERVSVDFDFEKLYTRLVRNCEILSNFSVDIPWVLTQISVRDRVSRRFIARVKKHEDDLPPASDRYTVLYQKSLKFCLNTQKDMQ
ncbi:MAG: hypothetical protein NC212_09475 [Staphylococcus sp.]|nr:hypothetical protein [Staphylococcus sp.]